MEKHITTPFNKEEVLHLRAGDYVYITGILYAARDAAHKRMYESLLKGEDVPMPLKDNVVYYLGPTPAKKGQVIGSAGPTTSSRMDKYTSLLIQNGMNGMIGKGIRNQEVKNAITKYKAVYFAAVGGAGALLSKCIKDSKVIAYEDLGTEAIRRLEVDKFPAIVVMDCMGNDLYESKY